jgi:hypothetical protein
MWPLTRLDISLGVDDIIDLPTFIIALKEKLTTITTLSFLPTLKTLKLVPSPWMVSSTDISHRRAFGKLLEEIRSAWTDGDVLELFGWKKSIQSKEEMKSHRENVFLWESGVVLDVTEIAEFEKDIE